MICATINDDKTVKTWPVNRNYPLYDELVESMVRYGKYTIIFSNCKVDLINSLERLGLEIEE